MGFKKGNQNIDSVFYGTDYVERMYLGRNQFFRASFLDFYKTNFFSIGLGQKKQINRAGEAISLIQTEWSPQYGYQLEIKQDRIGASMNYTDSAFRDNFSFILPKGKYLVNAALKNMPTSTGELYCHLLKKGETPNQDGYLTTSTFSDGLAKEVSVDEDTEVYLGMYIKDLNVGKTTIFSLELSPAKVESGKFVEKPSLMVRGRKKEIYNAGTAIDIKFPETAFYSGKEYPVEYIDSDAFNYEVTENGKTVSQPLTKISQIIVEGNSMIGFGNRAFQNCSNCVRFSCTSRVFQGGLFANNAAFEGCGALERLYLPIVKNINGLRKSQNLKSIFMGGRDNYSFDDSFAGNTSIEKIHWKNKDEPSGIEKPFTAHFGISSFEGCKNLKTIVSNDYDVVEGTLGKDTVFIVDDAAFAYCTSLDTKGTGFGSNTGPLYSSIGSQAFENCTGITSINLPNTVTSIGSQAFSGCSSLETINIPFIGESATSTNNKFSYIFGTVPTSLKTVGFSQGNNITEIPDYAFQGCSNITSINGNDTENIVSIGAYGYAGTGITSIKISSTLVSIGSQAFSGCTGLTSIDFGTKEGAETIIGSQAFENCTGITSINLPNTVTSIGSQAFSGCSNLETITIPFIGESATSTNNNFSYIFGTVPTSLTTVNFSKGNEITEIPNSAFRGCSNLTSITIPDSVTSIRYRAFEDCSSLKSITIPVGVTSIGNSAFYGCSSLISISIPNSVTSIGNSAFQGCGSFTSINLPNSVTSIGTSAFRGCSSLKSITIPNSVTSIRNSVFSGCSSLTSINLPNSVTSIGTSAFDGCSSLTSINIPNSVISIDVGAFMGCSSLTSINIPNSVTSIGDSAFQGCGSLTSIIIPNSVTSIGSWAFYGCSSLTIYAEAVAKPDGWNSRWNPSNRPVVWGYKG